METILFIIIAVLAALIGVFYIVSAVWLLILHKQIEKIEKELRDEQSPPCGEVIT